MNTIQTGVAKTSPAYFRHEIDPAASAMNLDLHGPVGINVARNHGRALKRSTTPTIMIIASHAVAHHSFELIAEPQLSLAPITALTHSIHP